MFSLVSSPLTNLIASSRCILFTLRSASSFKSAISVDKLYPKSKIDYLSKPDLQECLPPATATNDQVFSGYIPIDKLNFTYKTCSKPGGQHVNKTETGVVVRFHVDSADWIPKWIREKLKTTQMNNINKEGFISLSSEKTRKRMLNQADCLERLRAIIFSAGEKPKGLDEHDKLKIEINKKIADGRRLVEKRRKSESKTFRKKAIFDALYDYYGEGAER